MDNKKLDFYTIYDRVAEGAYINRVLGSYAKRLIDENQSGQCMFDVALMLDDVETMMHRYAIDGDTEKASRKIHFPMVEGIMTHYLDALISHYTT